MSTGGVNIRPFNNGNVRMYSDPRTASSRNVDEYSRYPLTQESTSFVTNGKSNAASTSGRLAINNANYEQSYPVQSPYNDKNQKRKTSLGEPPPSQQKQPPCTTFRQPSTRKSGVIRIDARDYSDSLDSSIPAPVMTLPRPGLSSSNFAGTTTTAAQKTTPKAGYMQRNPSKPSLYAPAPISHTISVTSTPLVTTSAIFSNTPPPGNYAGSDPKASTIRRQQSGNNFEVPSNFDYSTGVSGGTIRRSQPTSSAQEDSVVYPTAYADTLLYQTHGRNGQGSTVDASRNAIGISNQTFSNSSLSALVKEPIVSQNGQQTKFDAQRENTKNMKKSSSIDHKVPKSESKSKDQASIKRQQKPPKDIIAKDQKRVMGRKALCCICVLILLFITAMIFVIYFATKYSTLRAELVDYVKSSILVPPSRSPSSTGTRKIPRKTKPAPTSVRPTSARPPSPTSDMANDICLSPECIKAAGIVLQRMNRSVDPCEDFYEYSCGNWISNINMPPDKIIKYGIVQEIEAKNQNLIYEILMRPDDVTQISANAKWKNTGKNVTLAEQKAKLFFKSCLDISTINRLGSRPMLSMIEEMGGWDALGNWDPGSWDIDNMLYTLQGEHNVNALFVMTIQLTGGNKTNKVLRLDADGITIPDPRFYVNDQITREYSTVATAYKHLIRGILSLLGARNITSTVDDIYTFEKLLARTMATATEDRTYLTIQELSEICPQIKWFNLLQRIFKKQTLTHSTRVLVSSKTYMKSLAILLRDTDPRMVHNYMVWRAVVSASSLLSTKFRRKMTDFTRVLRGYAEEPPLWKHCLIEVRKHFGIAVGALFVRDAFSAESKRSVELMVRKIRNSFRANMGSLKWMDPKTKRIGLAKLIGMSIEVGYPNELFSDQDELNEEYKFGVGVGTYFQNVRNSVKHKISRSVDTLYSSRWTTRSALPQTMNAFYSSELNKAFFPAGLLQWPLFDLKLPRALTFGGIGSTIGHEITHGYDQMGQRHDADGRYGPWWSEKTLSQYQNKSDCLVKYYSKYTLGDKAINGAQTLLENNADIAGLKVSYMAYRRWSSSSQNKPVKQLPGLNLTDKQLFFVGYAQMWCVKTRKSSEYYHWQLQQKHSPEKYRVLGGLSQHEEFAKAFNCRVGSPMNPESRCSLW